MSYFCSVFLPLGELKIEVPVLPGGVGPGYVLGHVALDDLVPVIAVGEVHGLGAVDGVEQQARVVAVKGEAVAVAGEVVVGLHGVLQAAGLAHDGQSAVVHGVELSQSAGLEAGRHQKRVGTGIDAVRARLVILDACAERAVIGALVIAEGILILLVSGAEHDDLGVAV